MLILNEKKILLLSPYSEDSKHSERNQTIAFHSLYKQAERSKYSIGRVANYFHYKLWQCWQHCKSVTNRLTCPDADLRAFSSILMRLEALSSGEPETGGRGPAPADAGLPIEAEEGDRELVGVRLLQKRGQKSLLFQLVI